jgi:membrane protein YqaA with SNARE-associated domain
LAFVFVDISPLFSSFFFKVTVPQKQHPKNHTILQWIASENCGRFGIWHIFFCLYIHVESKKVFLHGQGIMRRTIHPFGLEITTTTTRAVVVAAAATKLGTKFPSTYSSTSLVILVP